MTSFSIKANPRRRAFMRLISDVRHVLNEALGEEHATRNLTKADIARILDTNKSFVTRKLSGESNMTMETLSDLAFALDRNLQIRLPRKAEATPSNFFMETKQIDADKIQRDGPVELDIRISAF